MDNGIILTTFNKQFIEFIEDIQNVFPDDLEINTCKTALIAIRKTNPKLLITIVKNYLIKYKTEINNENIDFFINNDYKNDIEENSSDNATNIYILEKIDKLRNPIKLMNEQNKKKISKYLINLLKLTELYN
jgi:hypothetical protein